jgi:hypothetical protein
MTSAEDYIMEILTVPACFLTAMHPVPSTAAAADDLDEGWHERGAMSEKG